MLVKLCPIEGEVCAELLTSRGRDRASAKRKHLRPDHFVGLSQRYDAIDVELSRKAKG